MTTKKTGRPRNPELLEQFTMRLTPRAKRRLKALADLTGKPSYTLLEVGFWKLLESEPKALREAVETIAGTVEQAENAHRDDEPEAP